MERHATMSRAYRPMSAMTPTNPNSSARTQKMKSVGASGRKPWVDCVALPMPLPNRPPLPMAILAWARL